MLKQAREAEAKAAAAQPPSGGCVLKPVLVSVPSWLIAPAAFGRLCVETIID